MFTIQQIHQAIEKVKSGADFSQFVQDLKKIGVTHYDNFVSDGRTKYYGINNFTLVGESKYPKMEVNNTGSADKLKLAIKIHQQGQTDYPTFCQQAANAGVEKWTTHMLEMKVTYLDKKGDKLTVEPIPQP
ncbi:MAG TPA: phage envelope protein [Flavobacteriaceae bacterium]|nr:phage envelope protein [Flavobacteriaceae bacterium]HAT63328.1 phage envelope protein [Flavobacteriaceae bacterium]|tara:strand:- start:187 stop:579 length:393 start_codon:yes stop_codon:yes gene_type:complete